MKVTRKIQFGQKERKHRPEPGGVPLPGRVPRVARLMALAIHFEGLLRSRAVRDRVELAALCGVTRPRITQIMNLLHLAPDIQEAVLFLPETHEGRDPLCEQDIRTVVAAAEWSRQRRLWADLLARTGSGVDN